MTQPFHPEQIHGDPAPSQAALPLAAEGVQRFVWKMKHGDILIEILDGVTFVNGERVEPIAETLQKQT